ncbi:MAG: hypothetical protein HYT22_01100 [Candidatus Niyogibacteria bacterium]|nr:hypothetical protein [Candidatus Niyogibacteria bacterium]
MAPDGLGAYGVDPGEVLRELESRDRLKESSMKADTRSEGIQGFWEGKASAMTAAREQARELRAKSDRASAECVLASAHYSRATTLWTRGPWWLPFVLWHFWRARRHVRKILDGSGNHRNLSPEQFDVAGTILMRGPFPDISTALWFFYGGYWEAEEERRPRTQPHTKAFLRIGLGECRELPGREHDSGLARRFFGEAADLIPAIESFASLISELGSDRYKCQLVRVLKRCGAYFKRVGDPRGDEFLARAEKLAAEASPDQLAKIKAGI